jgi:predicted hydrocarbon binding protein
MEDEIEKLREICREKTKSIEENEKLKLRYLYEKVLYFKISDENDVIRLAMMAYGWMPTMNKGRMIISEIDLTSIKDLLIKIQNTTEPETAFKLVFEEGKSTIDEFRKITNNSVVGLSKTLHILNPNIFPIVDKHLYNGIKNYGHHIGFKLESKKIDLNFYRDFTKHLIIDMKLEQVRELEKMLFDLGKEISIKNK